ncbi:MAG: hypothetical protein MUC95_00560 [Spirochaetes bacterium]|nr:hypothetical protein [Spirochaetota bacterium]
MFSNKRDKDINNLILSIQKSMTEFAEGSLQLKDAEVVFKKLSETYKTLEAESIKHEGPSILKGLCYYNSIENFSILSGVYFLDPRDINPFTYHGDNSLNTKAMNKILTNKKEIKNNQVIMIQPDEMLLHPVYVYPVLLDKNEMVVLATVSSSPYFSKEKFYFTGKLLSVLFSIRRDDFHFIKLNYFDEISKEIEKIIKENIDDDHYIEATLFVFKSVEMIFSHLGLKTLVDVSDSIVNILKTSYQENSRCFSLSIRDYIVILKKRKGEKAKSKKKRLNFIYKDINIPFKTMEIEIDKVDSIHNFWEKILLFENYLETGDIIK